jgi:hypothetical protein
MATKRDPTVNVHVRLTTKQYDATYAQARAERLTMADWIRRVLRAATTAKVPGRDHAG